MSERSVAVRLHPWRMNRPETLLEFFALSRDAALAAAGEVAPNTDTRILSEVRLAGLIRDPQGAASPYELLKRHYRFELGPYLDPQTAPQRLFQTGRYLREQQWESMLQDLLEDLRMLDSQLAEKLEAEGSSGAR